MITQMDSPIDNHFFYQWIKERERIKISNLAHTQFHGLGCVLDIRIFKSHPNDPSMQQSLQTSTKLRTFSN